MTRPARTTRALDPIAELDLELARLAQAGLARENVSIDSAQGPVIERGGQRLLNLASNDYLALAGHPRVRAAAAEAAMTYGAGAGASRLLGGDLPVHRALEADLAALLGTEGALLFPSGWHANTGVIPALADEGDAIFSDALNHASIVDGCRLSRARRYVYRHADAEDLEALLTRTRARRRLIVTDSLFSMDGDAAPLPDLVSLAERHGALVMVDEAHAVGVYGDGAGLCRELGVERRVHVRMGTLGKALGASGAFVAGEERILRFLVSRCRSYIFTTAPAPAPCGAARAAVAIVRSEEGHRLREAIRSRARGFAAALSAEGLDVLDGGFHLLAAMLGEPKRAMRATADLEEAGIFARAVRPPTVPTGTSRLRLSVCAAHDPARLSEAARAIARAARAPARRRVGT